MKISDVNSEILVNYFSHFTNVAIFCLNFLHFLFHLFVDFRKNFVNLFFLCLEKGIFNKLSIVAISRFYDDMNFLNF
jgi:hypothetical protein